AAQRGIDAVVACGGDGTMNEVANGLAGSETAMATVRGGTANVWAKEIGAPKDLGEAVRVLVNGEPHSMDLGLAGDRHFLLMAGIGFDASIVQHVSPRLKRWSGALAYAVPTVLRAFSHRSFDAELVVDKEALSTPLYWLLLGNTRNYGGILNLTHQAKADDGLLDFCLVQHGGLPRLAWLAIWALLRRHQDRAEVVYRMFSSLEVRTPGLPVQLDGDYFGETPMTFSVAAGALRVLVPPGQTRALFSQ
ncbi:MAG: diacylglycerol kinase family lipid kinase, partial [Chloroflexi bacterium]|nr:diacylglycerol kinase family lipid kinase [Chloroflexota bacterium]